MKYSNIILKIFSITVICLLFVTQANSQTTTNSPYSKYGIGDINLQRFNANFGMAGAGIAYRTKYLNNAANPASLSSLDLIAFEAAVTGKVYNSTSGNQTSQGTNTYLSHIYLAMPITDWWGASFGIKPYSGVGYNYGTSDSTPTFGTVNYSYAGSGGLNQIFLANGFEVAKGLSIGVNSSFVFGSIDEERKIIYADNINAFNTSDKKSTAISDVKFDFGLQYYKTFKEDYTVTFGAYYELGNKLNANVDQLTRSFRGNVGFERYLDTTSFLNSEKVEIELPAKVGVGIALEKSEKWMFELDYLNANWSQVKNNRGGILTNSQTIITGYKILPNSNAYSDYLKRLTYSFGARLNNSYLELNNKQINEYGISFGVSLPFRKSLSSLSVGAEVGSRGEDTNGLIKENFINFQIGITFNDKWFIKRKYD